MLFNLECFLHRVDQLSFHHSVLLSINREKVGLPSPCISELIKHQDLGLPVLVSFQTFAPFCFQASAAQSQAYAAILTGVSSTSASKFTCYLQSMPSCMFSYLIICNQIPDMPQMLLLQKENLKQNSEASFVFSLILY